MKEDILDFEVLFYSPDGETSPVLDYITSLLKSNREMSKKAIQSLKRLPLKIYDGQDIKPFASGKHKFWELRVRGGSNICRFFYIVQNPNVIVLFGFTKKTQKTDTKDIKNGIKCLEDFLEKGLTIKVEL
jgi:phage-related protein